jgi:hypothetical protein
MTRKEAIEYLIKQKKGYINDIINVIGKENFNALSLLGFIKRGKEVNNKDSWQITKSAEEFLKPYNKKISFFDKIRYYLNSKLS